MIHLRLRKESFGGCIFCLNSGAVEQIDHAKYKTLLAFVQAGATDGATFAALEKYYPDIVKDSDDISLSKIEQIRKEIEITEYFSQAIPADCLSAPSRVFLELTKACNLRCKTCYNSSGVKHASELTDNELFALIDELSNMGVFEIRMSGGEPTMHPSFKEIVRYAKSKNLYVSMNTNGVFDSSKKNWIFDIGVDWFIISIDGDKNANDFVRGAGSFDKTIDTINELHRRNIRTRFNMVVGRHNINSLPALAKIADEYKIEVLSLLPLRPTGRAAEILSDQMFNRAEYFSFIKSLQELRKSHNVRFSTPIDLLNPDRATNRYDRVFLSKACCPAGYESAIVGFSGDVYGCSYSPASFPESEDDQGRRIFVAGNVRKNLFSNIWRDSSRWSVFRRMEKAKNKKCLTCNYYQVNCIGSCPVMGYYFEKDPSSFDPYCFVELLDEQFARQ